LETEKAIESHDLAALALPGTTIVTARSVPAGSFTPPTGAAIANLPAFCRVAGSIKPSADSDIRFG
jgi:feruloyl esterase